MLNGMISILVAWALMTLIYVGMGVLVFHVVKRPCAKAEDLLYAGWIGWAVSLFGLQVWHLVGPVGKCTWVVFGLLSCLGWWKRTAVFPGGVAVGLRSNTMGYAAALLLVGFAVWLSNRAMAPVAPYDAGLYHLSAISWVKTYPIVPGLGNLHFRLGDLSPWFLYHAVWDSLPGGLRSFNVCAGWLTLLATAHAMVSVCRLASLRYGARDVARVLVLLPVLRLAVGQASSTSPDVGVMLCGVAVFAELSGLILDRGASRDVGFDRWFTALFCMTGAMCKMSMSVLAAGGLVVLFAESVREMRWNATVKGRIPAWLATVPVMGVVWMARSTILSGYLFFPVPFTALDLEWKVSEVTAVQNMRMIKGWAIQPGVHADVVLKNMDWVWPWFKGVVLYYFADFDFAVLAGIAGAIAVACVRGRDLLKRVLLLGAPVALAIPAWFVAAPDVRFAGIAFWWFAAAPWTGFISSRLQPRTVRVATLLWAAIACMVVMGPIEKFVDPGPERGRYAIPVARVRTFTTRSGLQVFIPVGSDQAWEAPLPNTPYPHPGLTLRRPGDLSHGFRIGEEE